MITIKHLLIILATTNIITFVLGVILSDKFKQKATSVENEVKQVVEMDANKVKTTVNNVEQAVEADVKKVETTVSDVTADIKKDL